MNQLDDRLTSLLARSAAAVEVRPDIDRVLDTPTPDTPGETGTSDAAGPPAPPRPRRLLLAAALVVVVALAAGALALQRSRHDSGEPALDAADVVTIGDPPDGWLVPTWLPEGQQPWTVAWEATPAPAPDVLPQLFGDPDAGRAILVTATHHEVRADADREVTVRGQSGRTGPTWNVEEKDTGEGIAWNERGVTITALYQGMTAETAIAALDALEWRSDDPADGFAAPGEPGDGSLPLRAEASRDPSRGRDAMLDYSDGPPAGNGDGDAARLGLGIFTSTDSSLPGRYLEAWYEQGAAAGGGERPLTTFDEDWHQLSVVWPDGRSIDITPAGVPQAELPDREVLQRIADSLAPSSEDDMAALRTTAEANATALPVLASVTTRIGEVDVRGAGALLRLCRTGPTDPGPSCPVDTLGGGRSDDGALVTGDWTVDGTWYVVVASTGEPPQILGARDPSRAPDAGELPAETATSGEWTIRLVEPAADIGLVCTGFAGSVGCTEARPS